MTYRIHPLWKVEKLFRPSDTTPLNPNKNVKWISHHIPKTAGSSLRYSFASAVGKSRVFGVYANTGATEMSAGEPVWVPSRSIFIHGHFRPHPAHLKQFPNAKRLVWIRDPIERIWSLVGHLLALGVAHPHYSILEKLYIDKGITDKENIVYDLIKHKRAESITHIYTRFFSDVLITDFDFVGSVHRYSESIDRLVGLLDLEIKKEYRNVRNKPGTQIPKRITSLKGKLGDEYDVVNAYL